MKTIEPTALPALDAATATALAQWREITVWLAQAKTTEAKLRKLLAAVLFPSPVEGTNKVVTADGHCFTLIHSITRSIDTAALDSVMEAMPEEYRNPGVLIDWKPSLVISGLRVLPDELRQHFSQALVEKPAMPKLEYTPADLTGREVPALPQGEVTPVAEVAALPAPPAESTNAPAKKRGRKKKS